MHYTSSKQNNLQTSTKRDLFSPTQSPKSGSYSPSPQYSPKHETDAYQRRDYSASKRETEVYSPRLTSPKRETEVYSPRLTSPKRELYSPKFGTEVYSSNTQKTTKQTDRVSVSPPNDYYYNKENELYSRKNFTDTTLTPPREKDDVFNTSFSKNYSEKYSTSTLDNQRNELPSPVQIRSSPVIRNSPVTITSHYESTTRNTTSSPNPRNYIISAPAPRHQSSSPSNYLSSTTHRISSPVNFKGSSDAYKVSQHSSTYKTSNYVSDDSTYRSSPTLLNSRPPPKPSALDHSITTTTHRISSPVNFKTNADSYKVSQHASNYKSSNYVSDENSYRNSPTLISSSVRQSPIPAGVDSSSNIRVSGLKGGPSRRDSWDAINKTKHILSHNSLESLANMTEKQLNTDLSYDRPKDVDNETHRNTQYNRFALSEAKLRAEKRFDDEIVEKSFNRPTTLAVNKYQDSAEFNSKSNYTTTIKETNERYVTRQDGGDYGYSTSFRPIDKNATGARAIRVQDIPNGVIGRPVEFESEFLIFFWLENLNIFICLI